MNDSLTEEPHIPPDNQPRPPLMLGFGFLPRLLEPGWIALTFLLLKNCHKYFWKPAAFLAFAFTAPYIELWALNLFIASMTKHGTFTTSGSVLAAFIPPLIVLSILSIAALVSVFLGLGVLLIALTATCRTILVVNTHDKSSLGSAITSAQTEGVELFRQKKGFLAKVWLIYALFMLLPTTISVFTASVVMIGMPQLGGTNFLPIQLNIPPEMMVGCAIMLGLSLITLSNYALILVPFSAVSKLSASKAALSGLVTTLKTLPGISIYSAIFFVLSSIFSAPGELLLMYNLNLLTESSAMTMFGLFIVFKLVWHALFFIYLVPISLLIPCEMIRGNVD